MKSSTAIFAVLVTLSFLFSLTALLIVTQNSNMFANSPTSTTPTTPEYAAPPITNRPTPINTTTPAPTPTPAPPQITFIYTEKSRVDNNNGITKLTLTIDIKTSSEGPLTVKYSDFYLQTAIGKQAKYVMTEYIPLGIVTPQNSGNFVLGWSYSTQIFELTFELPSTTEYDGESYFTSYRLEYSGSADVPWPDQNYYNTYAPPRHP